MTVLGWAGWKNSEISFSLPWITAPPRAYLLAGGKILKIACTGRTMVKLMGPRLDSERYWRRMLAGGVGPTASIVVLLFLPIAGAFMLRADEFAVWTIFNSVATISLSIDFGGAAFASANANRVGRPGALVLRGILISGLGSVLVCLVAMAAWVPYSHSAAAGTWSVAEGELALIVVMGASVFRSASSVIAAAALARYDYVSRNILLLGQSIIATALTLTLLGLTASAWSLPIGWLLASAISVAAVAPRVTRDYARRSSEPDQGALSVPVGSAGQFALKRTVAGLIGSVLLQGDRWVIGAIAGPEFLAAYELVWRFASAPRILSMSVSGVFISDARAAAGEGRLGPLLREGSRAVWFVTIAVGSVSAAAIVALGAIGKVDRVAVALGIVVLVGLAINGRTSITSMAGIGIGRVGIDLPYLIAEAVLTCLVWVVASRIPSGIFLVVGSSIVLSACSFVFFRREERSMAHDWSMR